MADTESHGPTEEAIEAAAKAAYLLRIGHDPAEWDYVENESRTYWTEEAEAILTAAYPLIRAQVCQELAEALRAERSVVGRKSAARFVEQFGTDRPRGTFKPMPIDPDPRNRGGRHTDRGGEDG